MIAFGFSKNVVVLVLDFVLKQSIYPWDFVTKRWSIYILWSSLSSVSFFLQQWAWTSLEKARYHAPQSEQLFFSLFYFSIVNCNFCNFTKKFLSLILSASVKRDIEKVNTARTIFYRYFLNSEISISSILVSHIW